MISGEALAAIELVASLLYIADVSLGERSSDRVSAPTIFLMRSYCTLTRYFCDAGATGEEVREEVCCAFLFLACAHYRSSVTARPCRVGIAPS